jgi:hypothetical protein
MCVSVFTMNAAISMGAGPVHFAGHSLGGSLAKLLAARFVVTGQCLSTDVSVRTFGSPPVFSSSCGGHGSHIMRQLGIPAHRFRDWVLDYDPVPRAMISADPYYQLALKNSVCCWHLFSTYVLLKGTLMPIPRQVRHLGRASGSMGCWQGVGYCSRLICSCIV